MRSEAVNVVSAIYGGYDWPKQVPPAIAMYEPILYTDDEHVADVAVLRGWQPRVEKLEDIPTPMLRAKYWKTHLHQVAPGTISIWLDGSMTITDPNFMLNCVAALGDDDISFTPHPDRTCIYPEAQVTASLARYADCDPLAQVDFYRRIVHHPPNWGLFASGAFTVRHSSKTEQFMTHWWNDCVYWTYQDQLSLPVLVKIFADGDGLRWNKNMPWHRWWSLAPHGH